MSEMPDMNLYQQIVVTYKRERKVAAVVKDLRVPAAKVRRVLITEGLWSSPTSRKIAALLKEGFKKEEIAERLHCSVHAVEFYLPYKRGAYGLQQSNTAQRIEDMIFAPTFPQVKFAPKCLRGSPRPVIRCINLTVKPSAPLPSFWRTTEIMCRVVLTAACILVMHT